MKLLQHFECLIRSVSFDTIEVDLLDVTAGDEIPGEIATIAIEKIPSSYHVYLEPGQDFTWCIYELDSGEVVSTFNFVIRYFTEEQIQHATQRAEELSRFFGLDNKDNP